MWVQPLAALSVTASPTAVPPFISRTLTLAGRMPSWSFASFQAFVTFTDVWAGVCRFSISYSNAPSVAWFADTVVS